jgi:basic amino acid/polyamine antiporter, APA family
MSSRRLPVEMAIYRVSEARHRLPRVFGTGQLVVLGLGVMIGAGIFSLSGEQAAANAGPAVVVSFVVAALVCVLAALCYAELSSTIPVAGSVYTFGYVAFGEVWGWLLGWSLILEMLIAAALVARVWSSYLLATLVGFDVPVPEVLTQYGQADSDLNLVAPVLLLVLAALVVTGTKLSARVLTTVVVAKVAVIVLVVVAGARYVDTANYTPFVPDPAPVADDAGSTVLQALLGQGGTAFGLTGVFMAAGVITFAYIGFDLIATAAEDAREPARSIPRAMLVSLALVTVLYVAMAAVLVGLRSYERLGSPAPVSDALGAAGVTWTASVVNLGGLLAFTTVIMVVLIGQSRVLFVMGRDGLLPRGLGRVSLTFSAPSRAAAVAGVAAALLALYPGLLSLAELLVLGALFAFFFCAVGVLVLQRTQPELERGFRVPAFPAVPVLSALATVWLGLNLQVASWRAFGIWMAAGLVVYLAYGRRHSALAHGTAAPDPGADDAGARPPAPEPAASTRDDSRGGRHAR